MVSKKELTLQTKDNIQLKGSFWQTDNQPVALVILVHSLGGYTDRFDIPARYLCSKGIACVGLDSRGVSGAGGKKGDIPSFEIYHEDLELLLDYVVEHFSQIPVFLYGHSFGANIVFEYAIQKRNYPIKGIIASSPMLDLVEKFLPISLFVTAAFNKVMPTAYVPYTFDTNAISHDPAVIKYYNEDPLVPNKVTVRTAAMLLKHMNFAKRYKGTVHYPMLFMHGSGDTISSHANTKKLIAKLEGDVEYKEWEGLYHELHSELEKEQILDYVIEWMLDRLFLPISDQANS